MRIRTKSIIKLEDMFLLRGKLRRLGAPICADSPPYAEEFREIHENLASYAAAVEAAIHPYRQRDFENLTDEGGTQSKPSPKYGQVS